MQTASGQEPSPACNDSAECIDDQNSSVTPEPKQADSFLY